MYGILLNRCKKCIDKSKGLLKVNKTKKPALKKCGFFIKLNYISEIILLALFFGYLFLNQLQSG
jgi:hypothetical protein